MEVFEFVIVLVAIITVGKIIRTKMRVDAAQAPVSDDGENQRLRGEMKMLKDRIAVLERVITDQHSTSSLEQEIEKLRSRDQV